MFYAYVPLDKKENFYVSFSSDLIKRIKEHKCGRVFATKSKLPVTSIYYEASVNKYDCLKREKYLKSGPGRKLLKHRLRLYLKDLDAEAN